MEELKVHNHSSSKYILFQNNSQQFITKFLATTQDKVVFICRGNIQSPTFLIRDEVIILPAYIIQIWDQT